MPKAKPQTNRTPGRPKAIIDWDRVGKMCEAGASGVGIAATLGIDEGTLRKRSETDHNCSFSEFSRQKKAKGDELLRVAQFNTAMKGNVTMQIWLGKQRLGQADKTENKTELVNDLSTLADVVKRYRADVIEQARIFEGTNGKFGAAMPTEAEMRGEIERLCRHQKVDYAKLENHISQQELGSVG